MHTWTSDRVVALAPDAASASAGQALAVAKKWSGMGRSERAIWGLCQGSGKAPYQARVDLSEPAFKCSCPSRKFPCKHGLGLLLLFAKDPAAFKDGPEPGWVSEWITGREDRADKKAQKAQTASEKPVDPEAQAKRAAERESRVADGLAGCRVWLEDAVRRGLAAVRADADIHRIAARMVDAQAPGLAGQLRRVPELINSGPGWEHRTLDHLGRLHLLLRAGERLKELPPDLATDVRSALGWTQSKDDVLASEGITDRWVSLGQVVEEEDRLRSRRTWLIGRNTRRRALLLDFAPGLAPLPPAPPPGTEFEGEIVFFPSRLPLRALVKVPAEARSITTDLETAADASVEDAMRGYAQALAANPWVNRWPMALRSVRVAQDSDQWVLVDTNDQALPLRPSFQAGLHLWRLLAATGAAPATILVEWDGESALPLAALLPQSFVDLTARWAA